MMQTKKAKSHKRWVRALIAFAATLIVAVPFLWMLSLSFKHPTDIFSFPPKLFTANPTLDNYIYVWEKTNIPTAMVNSLLVTTIVVIGNCLLATAAGYALAHLSFRGSGTVFILVLVIAMVPVVVHLIPLFLVTRGVPLAGGNDIFGQGGTGLLDSYAGLVLPMLVQPLNIYLARQYFMGISREFGDSARIDGTSEIGIFFRIYMPIAKPIVATIAILSFTGAWEDFLWPLVIISSPEKQTLPLALDSFASASSTQYGPMMASAFLAVIPVLLVFVLGQRHFRHGLSAGGVKE